MKIGIFPNMGKEALYTFWGKLISILKPNILNIMWLSMHEAVLSHGI